MADRTRIVLEFVLGAVCAVAALLTALVPEWIEETTRMSPDAGSGAAEWAVVLGLAAAAVLASSRGVVHLRRRPNAAA